MGASWGTVDDNLLGDTGRLRHWLPYKAEVSPERFALVGGVLYSGPIGPPSLGTASQLVPRLA